ncbi:MAG: hypothetical protein E7517_08520 [Ruminococcaceae bacterium]|nr:hypothetical protein [Oscillospiraceae bacterium]
MPVWAIVLIVIGALVIAGTVCTLIIGHLFIKGVSEAVEEYDVESQLNEWSKEFEDYTTEESTTPSNKDSQKDFSKVERPELKDFSWYKGLTQSIPAGASTLMTDTDQISGRWKAYYVIDGKGYELNNIEISSKDNKITVTIDPYEHLVDGEWVYNSTAEKYDYSGEISNGGIYATSDKNGAITFFAFYEKDGAQYGFGSTMLQSGEMVDIALVRP